MNWYSPIFIFFPIFDLFSSFLITTHVVLVDDGDGKQLAAVYLGMIYESEKNIFFIDKPSFFYFISGVGSWEYVVGWKWERFNECKVGFVRGIWWWRSRSTCLWLGSIEVLGPRHHPQFSSKFSHPSNSIRYDFCKPILIGSSYTCICF